MVLTRERFVEMTDGVALSRGMPPLVEAHAPLGVGDVGVAAMDGGEADTLITLSPGGADIRLSLMAELDDNEGMEDRLTVLCATKLGDFWGERAVVEALEFMIDGNIKGLVGK